MDNISVTSEVTFKMKVDVCDLVTVPGSTARNLIFSPLVDSCSVAYQLKGTIEFPFLQRFQ